jgi:hypothetical protein
VPDQLTPERVPVQPAAREPRPGGGWQAPVIVLLFVVAGVLLGVLWEHLWSPTQGRVVRHEWFVVDDQLRYDLDGLRNEFSGTALFVSLGLASGSVLGAVSALLLARRELRTLAAVVVGSVLASVLMWQVGTRLGPADPQVLARTAPRGTILPDQLELGSLGALVSLPLGACLALLVVFFLVPGRRARPADLPR